MSITGVHACHRRADARSVGYLVSVRHGSAVGRRSGIAGNVARPHYQGEGEFVDTGLILKELDHRKLDLYGAAGRNVGDRLREYVGALLIEQRGSMASGARPFVDLARLFTLLDHGADFALAHHHGHAVYGAVMGQGKDVDGFHGAAQDAFKFLRDFNTRDKAADLGLDAGVFERYKAGHLAIFADDLQLAIGGTLPG